MTKKLKKPIAFVTVFAMLLSVLLFFPEGTFGGFGLGMRASAVTPDVPEGNGTTGSPYLIDTAGKLYWFADYVNSDAKNSNSSARLTADIVVNQNVIDGSGNPKIGTFEPWTPIGSESNPYCGIFDGNNHTISGLYFNDSVVDNVGLFGFVGDNPRWLNVPKISYVGIVDSYFCGGSNVGSICGSYKNDTTTPGSLVGCFSMGTVSGSGNVGGLIGSSEITPENCYYLEGRVSGASVSDAALAKSADKFTSGEVAYLLNKYPHTPVWGMNIGTDHYPKALIITDGLCTNRVYRAKDGTYHNHASELVACNDCGTIAAVKPALNANNYYEITNANELYWFSLYANSGEGIKALAILKNDIYINNDVLDENRNPNSGPFFEWTPIGSPERIFAGVFEGDGYRVSGVYINKPTDDYLGLFGYIDAYETPRGTLTPSVRRIGIIDSYVCGGNNYVGGLVGCSDTALERCYSTAKVVSANGNTSEQAPLRGGGKGTLAESAYISDSPRGYGKTAVQFANGDAAYFLSNYGDVSLVWGQNLSGENPDPLPVRLTAKNRVYYTEGVYHNHNAAVSDYCDYCNVYVAQEPSIDNVTGEYQISNRAELLWFAQYVNAGNLTASAVLTDDIVVNNALFDSNGDVLPDLFTIPVMGSYRITSITLDNPFNGSFKGNGHTISGLYYKETSTNRIGLIGYAGSSAEISGVRITNSYIEGYRAVGAVCGLNAGGTISQCSTDGCVIKGTDVGGICGTNERSATGGTITNCFNASKVIGNGGGGICGFNNNGQNSISKCVNIGILYGSPVKTCGTGTCINCYVLTNNPLVPSADKSNVCSIIGITDNSFVQSKLGSEWTKTPNDTANKKLYFPRLAAFSGCDISVNYTPKLVLESNDTSPVYYSDDMTFTFDAVLTLDNGEEYSAAGADTLLKLSDIDFKIVHNGNPDDFDRVSTSIDYRNMRLALKIGGHDAGYIYVDPSTNKITVKITEDINAGSHSFDIKYNGTALPVFTGLSVSHTVDIQKGIPDALDLPSATEISYGERLAESELKDANGNTDTVWQWVDETTVPKVSQTTQQIVTKNAVDDVNYDYSSVDGYSASTHLITKDITLTINRAVPTIVVTATPSTALPGDTVTVSAAISNPNNSSLTDLPLAELSYVIGTGSEQAITGGSFVIPQDAAIGTVITIIAKTSETENYAQATDRTATVTVTACSHANKVLRYDENKHWYYCSRCGANNVDTEAHRGGTATCTNKAVCAVCNKEYGTVDPNNHKNVASTWTSDATGHWHECGACHAKVDKAAHVSSGPATADKAEICTVCDYVITPKLGAVADPVILPAQQTFKDSLEITITCGTEGADIYYTLDGTTPTVSEENRYTGPITITQTTTVKAFAVKFGMTDSNVVSVKYTKKSSGGGPSGPSGPSRPSRPSTPTKPSIGGSSMSWEEIAAYLKKLPVGSKATIELNGITTVPVEVIKVIDERDLKVTFVVDSVRSWKTDGAKITAPAAADLTFIKTAGTKSDGLRGIEGIQFRINDTGIPTSAAIAFKADHAGKFANLYKVVDGKLTFVACAKLGEDGMAILPDIAAKGDYVAMLCEFSDLKGDMDNDGVLSISDASAVLKDVFRVETGENPLVADFDGSGKTTIEDALAILKRAFGIA